MSYDNSRAFFFVGYEIADFALFCEMRNCSDISKAYKLILAEKNANLLFKV